MSSKHPEDVAQSGAGVPNPPAPPPIEVDLTDRRWASTPALRPDVFTEADIEEMDRQATLGNGIRTRPLRRCRRILDFNIGEKCLQAAEGDTHYLVTHGLYGGWRSYYRNKEVGWTEIGRGIVLTDCIDQCHKHLNAPDVEDHERFSAHLKEASETVKTWPEWKQNVLGPHCRD